VNTPEVAAPIRKHIDAPGPGKAVTTTTQVTGRVKPLGLHSAARLRIPVDRHFDDNFYEAVAATYSALAALSSRPAAEIAEANGEPVSTVHSWIRQARRRGYLPAGRQGKAG
jgi:hypothetical protein